MKGNEIMKYCEECGATLEDDAIFCEECGTKQSSVVSSSKTVENTPVTQTVSAKENTNTIPANNSYSSNVNLSSGVENTTPLKKSSKTVVYISAIVISLVVIASAVFFIYPKFIKNSNNNNIGNLDNSKKSAEATLLPTETVKVTAAPTEEPTEEPTEKPTKKPKKKSEKIPERYDDSAVYDDYSDDEDDEDYDEEYIIPDSDFRKLTKSEVLSLSQTDRWIAKNEIYARYGRMFNNQELQEYFDSLDWYIPTTSPDDFDESVFSKVEKYNIRLLAKYENK